MSRLATSSNEFELVHDGRLKNIDDWDEHVATALAAKESVSLTENHWRIIHLMRDYYKTYNISPITKLLIKEFQKKYNQSLDEDELNTLFPGGIMIQATRIAGIPIAHLDAELMNRAPQTTAAKPAPDKQGKEVTHCIDQFEFEGQTYPVSRHGNLVQLHAWNERMAMFLANKEGISLTTEHWEIIHYLRNFYFDYGITPMVRLLMRHMTERFGSEKSNDEYLYRLFPGGPSRQGSRIAGLPAPQGCID